MTGLRSKSRPRLFVIIPVYNERPNIGALLSSLSEFTTEVADEFGLHAVFVDDCSCDGTAQELKTRKSRYPIDVIQHGRNRGPGAAFASAFAFLSQHLSEEDWVVTMEGDNTSGIDTLRHMLLRRKEGYDVVLASPYLYGGSIEKVSFVRMFISHVANGLVKIVLGLRGLVTFSSFFRLYRGAIIRKLQHVYGERIIHTSGFECMVELLAKLVAIGASISEVEMALSWKKRAGKSKMKISKTTLGYMRLFFLWIRSERRSAFSNQHTRE